MSLNRIVGRPRLWKSIRSSPVLNAVRHQSSNSRELPYMRYKNDFERDGVQDLYTPDGYNVAWTQYQQYCIDRLGRLTDGLAEEKMHPKDIAITYARNPAAAAVFNWASMAHNNHFFFNGLAYQSSKVQDFNNLTKSLEKNGFGTIETLRKEMLTTANAMFGPGFVWLVWAELQDSSSMTKGAWRILTTYLAGTPYPSAGYRLQSRDQNTMPGRTALSKIASAGNDFGGKMELEDLSKGPGTVKSLEPVLCVNTWQHAYLDNFGVAGKAKYLATWWNTIDWQYVDQLTPSAAKNPATKFPR